MPSIKNLFGKIKDSYEDETSEGIINDAKRLLECAVRNNMNIPDDDVLGPPARIIKSLQSKIDKKTTTDTTLSARKLLDTDNLVIIAFKPNFLHIESVNLAALPNTVESTDGVQKIGLVLFSPQCAKLMTDIINTPALSELKDGVKMMLHHEIGHVKLKKYDTINGTAYTANEALAQLYALSKVDDGNERKGINSMAALVAMGLYLLPIESAYAFGEEVFFNHWEERERPFFDPETIERMERMFSNPRYTHETVAAFLRYLTSNSQDLGITKFDYLFNKEVKQEVAKKAMEYFKLLEKEFGKANYDNAQRFMWEEKIFGAFFGAQEKLQSILRK